MNSKQQLKTAFLIGIILTIFLAYIDNETTSFLSIFVMENVPALIIFPIVIGGLTFGILKLFALFDKKVS